MWPFGVRSLIHSLFFVLSCSWFVLPLLPPSCVYFYKTDIRNIGGATIWSMWIGHIEFLLEGWVIFGSSLYFPNELEQRIPLFLLSSLLVDYIATLYEWKWSFYSVWVLFTVKDWFNVKMKRKVHQLISRYPSFCEFAAPINKMGKTRTLNQIVLTRKKGSKLNSHTKRISCWLIYFPNLPYKLPFLNHLIVNLCFDYALTSSFRHLAFTLSISFSRMIVVWSWIFLITVN